MKYSLFVFEAAQNPELCMEYCRHHTQVLSEYGFGGKLPVTREKWMDTPGVYAIVAFDVNGAMAGGVRVQLKGEAQTLPIESSVAGLEKVLHTLKNDEGKSVAELSALWTSAEARSSDLAVLLYRTATAMAEGFGADTLLAIASYPVVALFEKMGYRKLNGVGRSADIHAPAPDYNSVMMVPDLHTMELATADARLQIMDIRSNPTLSLTDAIRREMMKELQDQKIRISAMSLQLVA